MPWPVPAPGDISNRAAAIYEQALPGIDARNPNTVATTNCRVTEMSMLDLYYFQANVAMELMPDTAVTNLPRFGVIYGVPQDQPAAASGPVSVTAGPSGATMPAEVIMTFGASTTTYQTTGVTVIAANATADVNVVAMEAGTAGNLAAGSVLTISVPVEGLTSQSATVVAPGIEGGLDLESTASWRARILAEIRNQPSGGDFDDYVEWAEAAIPGVALAACPAAASGGGAVAVVIAMDGLVAPTSGQLAAVQAYINNLRPVTANVTVYAATFNAVNVTLHLNPDTPAIRAAATAALALSFAQDAAIGGTTYLSRLNAAISSSDGETSHEMSVPAVDVPPVSLFSVNVLGTVTFV